MRPSHKLSSGKHSKGLAQRESTKESVLCSALSGLVKESSNWEALAFGLGSGISDLPVLRYKNASIASDCERSTSF